MRIILAERGRGCSFSGQSRGRVSLRERFHRIQTADLKFMRWARRCARCHREAPGDRPDRRPSSPGSRLDTGRERRKPPRGPSMTKMTVFSPFLMPPRCVANPASAEVNDMRGWSMSAGGGGVVFEWGLGVWSPNARTLGWLLGICHGRVKAYGGYRIETDRRPPTRSGGGNW